MEELPKPETLRNQAGCWFRAGAQGLHVGVEEPFAPARKAHPCFIAEDLQALITRLRAAGTELRPDETLPGIERWHVIDPFGNRLELRQV